MDKQIPVVKEKLQQVMITVASNMETLKVNAIRGYEFLKNTISTLIAEAHELLQHHVQARTAYCMDKQIPVVKEKLQQVMIAVASHMEARKVNTIRGYELLKNTISTHIAEAHELLQPHVQKVDASGPYIDQLASFAQAHVNKVQVILQPYVDCAVLAYGRFLASATKYHHQLQEILAYHFRYPQVLEHIREVLTDEDHHFLQTVGFGAASFMRCIAFDFPFIATLMERRDATPSTFHLPTGEMTITPKDVYRAFRVTLHGRRIIHVDDDVQRQTISRRLYRQEAVTTIRLKCVGFIFWTLYHEGVMKSRRIIFFMTCVYCMEMSAHNDVGVSDAYQDWWAQQLAERKVAQEVEGGDYNGDEQEQIQGPLEVSMLPRDGLQQKQLQALQAQIDNHTQLIQDLQAQVAHLQHQDRDRIRYKVQRDQLRLDMERLQGEMEKLRQSCDGDGGPSPATVLEIQELSREMSYYRAAVIAYMPGYPPYVRGGMMMPPPPPPSERSSHSGPSVQGKPTATWGGSRSQSKI